LQYETPSRTAQRSLCGEIVQWGYTFALADEHTLSYHDGRFVADDDVRMRSQGGSGAIGPDDRVTRQYAVTAVIAGHSVAFAGAGLRHRRLRPPQCDGRRADREPPVDDHAASENHLVVRFNRLNRPVFGSRILREIAREC
jgi:hypothetical protein